MRKIRIHPSCALWLTGLFVLSRQNPISYLLPILFHEVSHALLIAALKHKISSVNLGASGLCITTERVLNYNERLAVSAAGPIGSILLFYLLKSTFPECAKISLALGVINLLPFSSFDGRGIFYPIISAVFGFEKCERICHILDVVGTVVLCLAAISALALTRANTSVLFLAIYLFSLTFLKNDGIF